MKFATLFDGERAVLINRNGEIKHLNGPKRVFKNFIKVAEFNQIARILILRCFYS
jgi:hypothetical protein